MRWYRDVWGHHAACCPTVDVPSDPFGLFREHFFRFSAMISPIRSPMWGVVFILAVLLLCATVNVAQADLIEPSQEACQGKYPDTACRVSQGGDPYDGTCKSSRCTRMDYTQTPPVPITEDCLICTKNEAPADEDAPADGPDVAEIIETVDDIVGDAVDLIDSFDQAQDSVNEGLDTVDGALSTAKDAAKCSAVDFRSPSLWISLFGIVLGLWLLRPVSRRSAESSPGSNDSGA